jgi:catechol 2,3-dioxygenase-like lactoylglutathione lyase family enzyme
MIRHHEDADGMADQSPFSTSIVHHFGLRVEDAEAAKRWLTTMLGFRVEREFQFAGHDFVFLSAGGARSPVIELIGGPLEDERLPPENISDVLKLAGWNHLCLQVGNVEECIADLRRRGVRILIDVFDGAAGLKIAFIADPWGNVYELLEPPGEERRTAP